MMTVRGASAQLGVTYQGAQIIIDKLVEAGILEEVPDTRPRAYVAREVARIFGE